ncbi:NADH-quinone oxidoreductase subunit NuoG [Leeia sp.]|uniref:NADH-quinone oxidoreductase subunit NuoG n=1 Tax=Leeia sp. TaxID=2884678 RepID=UPI0035B05025
MLEIEIDGQPLSVETGSTVMDAANQAGVYIPHFCYHKKLSIAANCRMCLVEVEKAPKPLPACATPVTDGMKVKTRSELALKAQKGVMEFLLINHPLDCPICDQGGECQLQDLAVGYGNSSSRYEEEKRVVPNKELGPLISTDMTRCIHCTRCVRFGQEIAGVMELGMANRGEHSEIMPFISKSVNSELSGNMIDLCPVGALTSKPFRYSARTWELSRRKSVSPHDGLGSNLIVQVKHNKVHRVLPLENEALNECWLSDRDRFSYEALNAADRLTKPMIKQDNRWHEVEWQQAIEYVAHGLQDIRANHGADALAGLISPQSTTEELYLFQKLLRGLGSNHIDHRLRQADFSADASVQGAPWLGQSVAELSTVSGALLIGSALRKEQPLLAARLRHAVKHGAKVASVSCLSSDLLVKYSSNVVVAPQQLVAALGSVLLAVQQATGGELSAELAASLNSLVVSDAHRAAAAALLNGEQRSILLGQLAQNHPHYAQLLTLANALAQLSGAKLGVLGMAANSTGAWLMGAVPMHGHGRKHTTAGHAAGDLLAGGKQAYVLFNTEPEFDGHNGTQALGALSAAKMVVYCAPFKSEAALQYADVLLPIAPFSETAGSFINMAGTVQTFNPVVKPQGDSRPGWKVLRVLGNLFDLPGFEQDTVDVVRAEWQQGLDIPALLSNHASVAVSVAAAEGLHRVGDVPLYQIDSLTRRAPALQATVDAAVPQAAMNAATLARLGLQAGDRVKLRQGGAEVVLTASTSEALADDAVQVSAAHASTIALGGLFDAITVERA